MDTKKYYYLKLKDNYFDQDNIKVLESMQNGHLYSLIILKLYLKACKYNGHLKMTESIPYDPKKINILAHVIGHDKDNVEKAINAGIELGLITMLESGEMWMTEIQNYIGTSSSEGDRKREYRAKLKGELISIGQMSGQESDEQAPEIEIEIEKEIEIKKKKEKKPKPERNIIPPTLEMVTKYCNERDNNVNPQKFIDHYEARGWIPKGYTSKMKDWQAAVRTWEGNNFNEKQNESKPDWIVSKKTT